MVGRRIERDSADGHKPLLLLVVHQSGRGGCGGVLEKLVTGDQRNQDLTKKNTLREFVDQKAQLARGWNGAQHILIVCVYQLLPSEFVLNDFLCDLRGQDALFQLILNMRLLEAQTRSRRSRHQPGTWGVFRR